MKRLKTLSILIIYANSVLMMLSCCTQKKNEPIQPQKDFNPQKEVFLNAGELKSLNSRQADLAKYEHWQRKI